MVESASELLSELISLLNIFTLYSDGVSKCILIKEAKKRQQLTQDIEDVLKAQSPNTSALKKRNGLYGHTDWGKLKLVESPPPAIQPLGSAH